MPTKGKDIIVKEKRGRSPLVPRKVKIGQQTRSPVSPTLERKHGLASTVSRKVHMYEKPTVSSTLYALNTIKHPFVEYTKHVPQSKVNSVRSMFNEKKVTNSCVKNTNGSTKTKDARKLYIVQGKKLMRQPIESKNIVVDMTPTLSKDNQNIVINGEDYKTIVPVNEDVLILENCNEQPMDRVDDNILTCELPVRESSSVPTFDESINIDHDLDDDYDNENTQQDQPDKISNHGSDIQQSRFEVDQEIQEPEDEQGVQEQEVEHEEMEIDELGPEIKEPDIKEGGKDVPKEEDRVVKNHEVVDHGKKDTAAYDYVMEVTLGELRQQRLNRVKALVGAFENVMSFECNTLQKSIKQH